MYTCSSSMINILACVFHIKNNQPLTSQYRYDFQESLLNCAWKHGVALSNEYQVLVTYSHSVVT